VRRLASELGQRAVDELARVLVERATERGLAIERSPVGADPRSASIDYAAFRTAS